MNDPTILGSHICSDQHKVAHTSNGYAFMYDLVPFFNLNEFVMLDPLRGQRSIEISPIKDKIWLFAAIQSKWFLTVWFSLTTSMKHIWEGTNVWSHHTKLNTAVGHNTVAVIVSFSIEGDVLSRDEATVVNVDGSGNGSTFPTQTTQHLGFGASLCDQDVRPLIEIQDAMDSVRQFTSAVKLPWLVSSAF